MTRKDYEMLAAALKRSKPGHTPLGGPGWALYRAQWAIDCEAIAQCIAKTHTQFDVDLFLRNCGMAI